MKIESKDISVVVQGAINKKITSVCLASIRKHLPMAEIILSTWKGSDVSGLDYDKLVLNEDPGAVFEKEFASFHNLNRQIVSTLNGIKKSKRKYILKFRSDILMTSNNFLKYYNKYTSRIKKCRIFKERVLVCDKYTRKENCLCFHISDWVMFGLKKDLIKIWNIDLAPEPETTTWFHNHELVPEHSFHIFKGFRRKYCAEQWIWMSVLKKYQYVEFKHMFDSTARNIELTNLLIANNIVVLSEMQFGIHFIKYKTNRDYCYSYIDWCKLYEKYFSESIKISNLEYLQLDDSLYLKERKKLKRLVKLDSKSYLKKLIITFWGTLVFKICFLGYYFKYLISSLHEKMELEQTEDEKRKQAESKKYLISSLPNLLEILKKYEKKGFLNIFLFQHLGDNFFRCSVKNVLEKKFKKPINFILLKSQKILVKLWNIQSYNLIDINKEYFSNVVDEFSNNIIFEYFKEYSIVQSITSIPNTNRSFIIFASNEYFSNYAKSHNIDSMMKYIYASLALKYNDSRIDVSSILYSNLSNDFQKKLPNSIPLNKIVLIAPECNSDTMLNKKFWNIIVNKLSELGYYVIENITNQNNHIQGTTYINFTVEEIVSLGMSCKAVFSLRSGLCDLLVGKGKNLFVVMSIKRYIGAGLFFGFKQNFKSISYPHEIILDYNNKPQMIFEGVDLLKDVPIKYFPGYRSTSQKILDGIFRKRYFGKIKNKTDIDKKEVYYFLGMPIYKKYKGPNKKYLKILGITVYCRKHK